MAMFNSKLFVYQRVDVDTYYHITIYYHPCVR